MSIPLYLSGAPRTELMDRIDLFGSLLTPQMGNRIPDGVMWGADNGCFNPKVSAKFKAEDYLAWLDKHERECCLFATAPDVVGDAQATLDRSLPILPQIRALGFKAALVAQDGLENMDVPWDAFDVLFIGGSTEWKLGQGAQQLCRQAHELGKWVHVGRVNSEKRLTLCAEQLEADSVDGTFLAFGPQVNLPRLRGWYGCPDCKQLVRPDEFGLHEGCPALRQFDEGWSDVEVAKPAKRDRPRVGSSGVHWAGSPELNPSAYDQQGHLLCVCGELVTSQSSIAKRERLCGACCSAHRQALAQRAEATKEAA